MLISAHLGHRLASYSLGNTSLAQWSFWSSHLDQYTTCGVEHHSVLEGGVGCSSDSWSLLPQLTSQLYACYISTTPEPNHMNLAGGYGIPC